MLNHGIGNPLLVERNSKVEWAPLQSLGTCHAVIRGANRICGENQCFVGFAMAHLSSLLSDMVMQPALSLDSLCHHFVSVVDLPGILCLCSVPSAIGYLCCTCLFRTTETLSKEADGS
ncbi:hypothetical protein VNO78_09836 [Psophocarpus tetragonolobus]|uniref:Uncharacterized protein n=1 Tax=Psophocarpus tetragonolobus TaxID=3891 RepID=A0AAN9XTS7_PSOTE